MESGWPFVQVDAFTDRAFGGNPAAVVFGKGGEEYESPARIDKKVHCLIVG